MRPSGMNGRAVLVSIGLVAALGSCSKIQNTSSEPTRPDEESGFASLFSAEALPHWTQCGPGRSILDPHQRARGESLGGPEPPNATRLHRPSELPRPQDRAAPQSADQVNELTES